MENLLFVPFVLAFVVGLTNFPRRQPDTLAPIQLITLNGAAAQVLLLIGNTVTVAYWWTILPRGGAAAFALLDAAATGLAALTAGVVLLGHHFRPRRPPSENVASWMQREVEALKEAVSGGHGIDDIRLYRGSSQGVEVEAIKIPNGAGIRVGEGLAEKLAHFRRHPSGGARRVRTLIRFTLLHELGHLLNGDHRAFQFARAIQLAYLWYLVPVLAFQPWMAVLSIRRAATEEVMALASMGLMLIAMALMAAFQRATAARFASARERLADWRATVTLTAEERARLFAMPPGGAPFLEMALSALLPPRMAAPLTALLSIAWPGAERIDVRIGHLIAGRSGGRHEPLRWSGPAGVNAGVLTVIAISLAGGATRAWGDSIAQTVVLLIAAIIATWPAVMLVGRADPTDPFSNEQPSWERRIVIASAYLLAHTLVVIAGYFVLIFIPPINPLQYTTAGVVIIFVALLAGGSAFLVGVMVELGPAGLRMRGGLVMNVIPFLLGFAIIVPLSLILARGIGSRMEYPFSLLLWPTFAIFAGGSVAVQSRVPLVRRLVPFGAHSVSDFVRCRVLTIDVAADMNDVRRSALFFRLTAIWSSQWAIAFAFVAALVLAILDSSPDQAIEVAFALGFFALFGLALWPRKKSTAPNRRENNLDTLHALFQASGGGPLGEVLERLKPEIAGDLRALRLRDPGTVGVPEIRRAAQWMELANAIGATDVIAAWTGDARDILHEHAADDVVYAWPGGPPSAYWTAWAARLAAATNQPATAVSLARAAAQLLPPRLGNPWMILAAAIIARIATATGSRTAMPSADMRRLLRGTDSFSDVAAIARYTGDGIEVLRRRIHVRLWQALHANSRRGFLILLDLLSAGSLLGEGQTPLLSAAEERLCDLLLADDEALVRRLGVTKSIHTVTGPLRDQPGRSFQ